MQLRQITRNIASAVILSQDNKVLFGKQDSSKDGVYMDCWHIPGGGVEAGETTKDALIREVMEETGLDITNAIITLIDDTQTGSDTKTLKNTKEQVICNMHFNDYLVTLSKKSENITLTPTDDLIELKWIDKNKLHTIKLTPPSVKLFKKLNYLI